MFLAVCLVLLDYREEGEDVPAYLARGCDRLFKALREWASDPDLKKVSLHIFVCENNNSNSNRHDNVYGAVIMAEFTQFI